uniref:Multidrug and toxin extrusion protein n=1 Tax=Macrostomum lignano TaxID=282301 RepID=A0A1I8IRR2_9PLAT
LEDAVVTGIAADGSDLHAAAEVRARGQSGGRSAGGLSSSVDEDPDFRCLLVVHRGDVGPTAGRVVKLTALSVYCIGMFSCRSRWPLFGTALRVRVALLMGQKATKPSSLKRLHILQLALFVQTVWTLSDTLHLPCRTRKCAATALLFCFFFSFCPPLPKPAASCTAASLSAAAWCRRLRSTPDGLERPHVRLPVLAAPSSLHRLEPRAGVCKHVGQPPDGQSDERHRLPVVERPAPARPRRLLAHEQRHSDSQCGPNSGHLDLQENIPMQYTDSAVNFTGQSGVSERFNIDELTSVCLTSLSMSVWVKVTNASRGSMPLLEGLTMPSSYHTRFWLHPTTTDIELTVASKVRVSGPTDTASGWTHIAAVYDKQTPEIRILVNGTRQATSGSATALTSCADFGSNVQIGAVSRSVSHNRVLEGFMRCFGVSERALSDSEVALLQGLFAVEASATLMYPAGILAKARRSWMLLGALLNEADFGLENRGVLTEAQTFLEEDLTLVKDGDTRTSAAVKQRAFGEAVNALAALVHADIQWDGGLEAPADVESGEGTIHIVRVHLALSAQYETSTGGCVVPQTPQHSLVASSARMCAFLCSQKLRRPCIAWSRRAGVCNMSDSLQTASLTNDTDCQAWSALRQLGLVAFWPMSNATRTRNAVSNSGHLDLQENIPMQYTDSAVNFTGQSGVSERFNIDELTSVCLTSLTMSVWVKVTNPARGAMPLLEGLTMPFSYHTRLWLYPTTTNIKFTVVSKVSVSGPTDTASGWTHIAAVYDRQTPEVRILVNGTRQATSGSATSGSATALTSCANFGSRVQIGAISRSSGHNRVFEGFMRCFGVSERALSDSEVALLQGLALSTTMAGAAGDRSARKLIDQPSLAVAYNRSQDSFTCTDDGVVLDTDNSNRLVAMAKRLWLRMFPLGFRDEFLVMFALSWPAILTTFFQFFLQTTSIIMCGQLGKIDLDSVALANSFINVAGICIGVGMSTACDTLFSQTFGSRNKKRMGMYLQRGLMVMYSVLVLLWCLHLNIKPVLLWLGQNSVIADKTARYMLYFMPGLFFDYSFLVLSRFLQNQNIMYPPMIAGFVGNIFNVVSQYLAIHIFDYGYLSSAVLQASSLAVMFFLTLIYTLCTGVYKDCWDGWKVESLYNWCDFVKLAVPGIFLIALEEWSFEISTIVAGTLGEVQLGAQSIVFQMEAISYMIPFGISVAVNIRVGQQLGGNQPLGAAQSFRIGLLMM